jgi:hypothetical protein
MTFDPNGGIVACVVSGYPCRGVSIINNIVSGTYTAAYAGYGHNCGDYSSRNFKNNIAHSNNGVGAIISPDPSSGS